LKNLPIGISTLKTIIEEDMIYIDKTEDAYNLIKTQGRIFLSRPRRFGKSLFLDTLKEIFGGNKELFKGLYIYDKWNWDKKYPVIKIDFAGGIVKSTEELNDKISAIINRNKAKFDIDCKEKGISNIFSELIEKITEKYDNKVVILVDEYDKPLLDNIEEPNKVKEIKEGLKSFYSVIKEQDANLQFVFLTGVSKFSRVSIFSGINNLNDITLDANFATICGYTQNDINTSFKEHLIDVDRDKLKEWYNGYNFLGEHVYNPFDILLFINKGKIYKNYWFETGTPTFLVKLITKNRYFLPDLNNINAGEEILSSFEIENIEIVTLLFQSGYLTIAEKYIYRDEVRYHLAFPNREVKVSLNKYLIQGLTLISEKKDMYADETYAPLISGDLPGLESAIKRLFASIPYRNFTNNELLESEGYYASVLYAFFSAINCEIIPEDISNKGQADMTIKLGNFIYVMEIKVTSTSLSTSSTNIKGDTNKINSALAQIVEREYSEKYKGIPNKKVFELGIIFSQAERNIVSFDWKEAR